MHATSKQKCWPPKMRKPKCEHFRLLPFVLLVGDVESAVRAVRASESLTPAQSRGPHSES
jgi:hypothetical protein